MPLSPGETQLPPITRRPFRGTSRAEAPPAALSLGPPGHGVGARGVPATRCAGRAPQRSGAKRELQERAILHGAPV
jgi:hypothetical protein